MSNTSQKLVFAQVFEHNLAVAPKPCPFIIAIGGPAQTRRVRLAKDNPLLGDLPSIEVTKAVCSVRLVFDTLPQEVDKTISHSFVRSLLVMAQAGSEPARNRLGLSRFETARNGLGQL